MRGRARLLGRANISAAVGGPEPLPPSLGAKREKKQRVVAGRFWAVAGACVAAADAAEIVGGGRGLRILDASRIWACEP